jgi:hypothetical protein
MLNVLDKVISDIPNLLGDKERWSTLIVNRRKPFTYRAFTNWSYESKLYRVCLHKFDKCSESESFNHPHPWPGAFKIIKGSYLMNLGYTVDRFSTDVIPISKVLMVRGSMYEITNPLTWHSVIPLNTCYTIMVNGEPWDADFAHTAVRTTKGKDLDKMNNKQIDELFDTFLYYTIPASQFDI